VRASSPSVPAGHEPGDDPGRERPRHVDHERPERQPGRRPRGDQPVEQEPARGAERAGHRDAAHSSRRCPGHGATPGSVSGAGRRRHGDRGSSRASRTPTRAASRPEDEAADGVGAGGRHVPVLGQAHELDGEGAVGREGSEHAGAHDQPHRRARREPLRQQREHEAEQERARDVLREGGPREAPGRDREAFGQADPGERPDHPADGDERHLAQWKRRRPAVTTSCPPRPPPGPGRCVGQPLRSERGGRVGMSQLLVVAYRTLGGVPLLDEVAEHVARGPTRSTSWCRSVTAAARRSWRPASSSPPSRSASPRWARRSRARSWPRPRGRRSSTRSPATATTRWCCAPCRAGLSRWLRDDLVAEWRPPPTSRSGT
jgi:hypothetical protein